MHANQTDVQKILGGVQQYVIPLFQRPYTWKARQWSTLWEDLLELCEEEKSKNHFLGSIVTMPSRSVPEGVSKFILIDGQQRLTTLLILLAAIRDKARQHGEGKLADKIDDLMLKNRHQDGTDVYKVLPSALQTDRASFCAIMDSATPSLGGGIANAFMFFEKKLRTQLPTLLDRLYTVVCKNLVLVSIVLDRDDNPYLIFESLNAKGEPLAQADLIRNFFFMRVHVNSQEKVFRECWQPMQERLGEHLTEFIRHFLMHDGRLVKQGDVYYTVKECVEERGDDTVMGYMTDLATFSGYYSRLTSPALEPSKELASRLARLNRFEATTAYPFLLNVYHDYARNRVSEGEFKSVLDLLEAFLIRRYVCGVPTNALSRIFVGLYSQAVSNGPLLEGVKRALADKNFPRDKQFREQFVTRQLYGSSDRRDKAKLILDQLEASFEHKEPIDMGVLTIEHVMPQTPNDWWKEQLGEDWASTHEYWLHTVGNLTLTGYNPDLSNSDFPKKKAILSKSHVELNRYFGDVETWDADAIARRGEALADLAVSVWPDFARRGDNVEVETEPEDEQEDVAELLEQVLDQIGGLDANVGTGRFRIYRLTDGRVVNLKYSRSHGKYYWFGLHASLWDDLQRAEATHVVLVLGTSGYATVPLPIMAAYVAEAGTSPKSDGTVRHFHVLVTTGPRPEMFHHGKPSRISLVPYFSPAMLQSLPQV
jgi:uncharacterized protein with ParB-like and HNH nuclease domain